MSTILPLAIAVPASLALLLAACLNAPEGYQDFTGFHFGIPSPEAR